MSSLGPLVCIRNTNPAETGLDRGFLEGGFPTLPKRSPTPLGLAGGGGRSDDLPKLPLTPRKSCPDGADSGGIHGSVFQGHCSTPLNKSLDLFASIIHFGIAYDFGGVV